MAVSILAFVVILILGLRKVWEKKVFIVLLFAAGLCLFFSAMQTMGSNDGQISSVMKNPVGEGEETIDVTADIEGEESVQMQITVPEQTLTKEEKKRILAQTKQWLMQTIWGENTDASHIDQDLYLPTSSEDAQVEIEWQSSDPMILSAEGVLADDISEKGENVTLSAVLSLEDESGELVIPLTVFPPQKEMGQKEQLESEIEKVNAGNTSDTYHLPESLNGEKVTWREDKAGKLQGIAVLLILAAVLCAVAKKQKQDQLEKRRLEALQGDYAELISRLLLLLKAGITSGRAFERMAVAYRKKKEEGGKLRHRTLFEEITTTVKEMKNGIGEADAYEHFGERCVLSGYKTVATLLIQNLKIGSTNIMSALEQEVIIAFEDRKRAAKAAGDAASIKLLLPMGMMLAVVLIVIIVPSFMAV